MLINLYYYLNRGIIQKIQFYKKTANIGSQFYQLHSAKCHYMPCGMRRLVNGVSGGVHVTRGCHVANSDFDRTVHVNWTLIGPLTLMLGRSFWKFLLDTWHVLYRHMPRVKRWLFIPFMNYHLWSLLGRTHVITWFAHVAPAAKFQALIGSWIVSCF
jgi:hypothetical protein